jgi:DnaD/phage-associated family protein
MSAQSDYFELIKQISGQKNVVTVPKLFVKITGDMTQAVVLSQCLYWSDRTARTDGYFYKTAKEFADDLGISERQLRYAVEKLEESGFISTVIHRAKGAPTTHYKVNNDFVTESILQICQIEITNSVNPSDIIVNSLTEITTEIKSTTTTPDERKNVYVVYEQNIGTLTPMIAEDLDDLEKTCTEFWVVEAIHEAVSSNARNIKYIRAILERWKVEGFKAPKKSQGRGTFPRSGNGRHGLPPPPEGYEYDSSPAAQPGTLVKKQPKPCEAFTFEQVNAIRANIGKEPFTYEEYLNA